MASFRISSMKFTARRPLPRLTAPRRSMSVTVRPRLHVFAAAKVEKTAVLETTKKIVEEQLAPSVEITESSTFEELGADSLEIVELTLAFETTFKIDIPDEDATKIRTVGEAVEYISKALESTK